MKHQLKRLETVTPEIEEEFANIFQPYIWNLLKLLSEKLPLDDSLINILDFGTLNEEKTEIKRKILEFNKKFKVIVTNEGIEDFNRELDGLLDRDLFCHRKESKESSLRLWDMIKASHNEGKYKLFDQIMQTAHVLPTSSATIEQAFSKVKFVKNALRSSLAESATQSLMFFAKRYQDEEIKISDDIVKAYHELIADLNRRRSGSNVREATESFGWKWT